MNQLTTMFESHPKGAVISTATLSECIDACFECGAVCTLCADACLQEPAVAELRTCIRTDLDCADVCEATGRVLARFAEGDAALLQAQVEACRAACAACASVCERHASKHEHCKACAEACRRCEDSCRKVLQAL